MADTNKKITDASTITSMAGTDKVFVNSGGDLKQMELDKMVAASAPVQTLNSNLGNLSMICFNIGSDTPSTTFSYYNCAIIIFCRKIINQYNIIYLDGVGGYSSQLNLAEYADILINEKDGIYTVNFSWKFPTNIQGIALYN